MGHHLYAGVAELADALDLGSSVIRRGGSSPLSRTSIKIGESQFFYFIIVILSDSEGSCYEGKYENKNNIYSRVIYIINFYI